VFQSVMKFMSWNNKEETDLNVTLMLHWTLSGIWLLSLSVSQFIMHKTSKRESYSNYKNSSQWRYNPGWALASSTMCLQASRFLALSFHSFKPIFLRSMNTSSSHLIFGLPLRLVAYSFPYNIFFLELRCLAFFLCDQATVFFGI